MRGAHASGVRADDDDTFGVFCDCHQRTTAFAHSAATHAMVLVARWLPQSASISRIPVGLVTFTSVSLSPMMSIPTKWSPRLTSSGPRVLQILRSFSMTVSISTLAPAAMLQRNSSPSAMRRTAPTGFHRER